MTITDDEYQDIPTDFGPMRVHVFRPAAAGTFPALVLFSEIYQVTGPIRRAAALFAGHGFVVAVPEIYHELEPAGSVLSSDVPGTERGNAHKTAKKLASYDADARATIRFLQDHEASTGSIGAVGICIGGHLAFRCAMNPEVLATACFYPTDIHKRSLAEGMHDDSLDRIPEIGGELLMVFGRQDPHVPREGRTLIYNALADSGVHFQWHEFNAAHAFLRDEGPRYDPAMAQLTYGIALEMFKRQLASTLPSPRTK
ncbi:dienelactone hydrolase family protein [soil metagenome]